jgi:hypothetical protein
MLAWAIYRSSMGAAMLAWAIYRSSYL